MDPSNQDILLEYRKTNFAPIPQLSLDSIILLFLKKYEVDVTPPESLGVDLSDRLLFAVAGPVAMLNTGLKNQIRSSKQSEWISWKQWALSHPEFNNFKCEAISKVDIYNSRLQEYLQSDEGIEVVRRDKEERYRNQGRENLKMLNAILLFFCLIVIPLILITKVIESKNLNREGNQSEFRNPN
jgi:hypothetical protein